MLMIYQIFSWAVGEEIIPAMQLEALRAVRGLYAGRSDAVERPPVKPVRQTDIDATIPELPEVVADMVRLQLHSAMRPGELCIMRPADIDRSGDVWFYSPRSHKNTWRGKNRCIAIGPKAQAVLLRYLARAGEACLFQPRDSEAKRLAAQEAARTTPMSCGNRRGTNCVASPRKQPGDHYTVASYRRAIHRAAKKAKVELWSPHRLRHTAGTTVRREFGLDACQAVLGHRHAQVSEVYGEVNQAKAVEVALRIG